MVGGCQREGEDDAIHLHLDLDLHQEIVLLAVGHLGRPVLAGAMVDKKRTDIRQLRNRTEEVVVTL